MPIHPPEDGTKYAENPLPDSARNHIFTHSSEELRELPDACVHLMVTSPPYNAGNTIRISTWTIIWPC